jgi:hypothetical protein
MGTIEPSKSEVFAVVSEVTHTKLTDHVLIAPSAMDIGTKQNMGRNPSDRKATFLPIEEKDIAVTSLHEGYLVLHAISMVAFEASKEAGYPIYPIYRVEPNS